MFRFTIRDLIWLTVVVAVGAGWWANRRSLRASREDLVVKADLLSLTNERLQKRIDLLEERAGFAYLLTVENDLSSEEQRLKAAISLKEKNYRLPPGAEEKARERVAALTEIRDRGRKSLQVRKLEVSHRQAAP